MIKSNETHEPENDGEDTITSIGMRALNYTNIVDRYFEKYYIDKGKSTEQYVFIHTNKYIEMLISFHFHLKCNCNWDWGK